jgi:hypothetical protein
MRYPRPVTSASPSEKCEKGDASDGGPADLPVRARAVMTGSQLRIHRRARIGFWMRSPHRMETLANSFVAVGSSRFAGHTSCTGNATYSTVTSWCAADVEAGRDGRLSARVRIFVVVRGLWGAGGSSLSRRQG